MNDDRTATNLGRPTGFLPVRMRGPADMAEMLPYLLGFFPDDSIVAVGLQAPDLQQGGVIRVDIPPDPAFWPRVAADTARLLVELSEQRDRRPEEVLLYLCRDSAISGPVDGRGAVAELRPLARELAQAFHEAGVTVKESLCVSGGRWWSFLCTGTNCCDPAGTPIRSSHGPSPLAAAATFAGLAPRGSRKAIISSLAPIGSPEAEIQRAALEQAGPPFIRELAGPGGRAAAIERTAVLLAEALAEFRAGSPSIDAERAARLLVGLQDKLGRDRGAEFTEPDELVAAQRLWRFLAQRCVPPFEHLASPPLTLLGWTAWLAGDVAMARIVLGRALELDPDYTLAQLLHESLNGGLAPDRLLESIRRERAARTRRPGGKDTAGRAEGVEVPEAAGEGPGESRTDDPAYGDGPSADGCGPGDPSAGECGAEASASAGPVAAPHRPPGRRRLPLRLRQLPERQGERRGRDRAIGG